MGDGVFKCEYRVSFADCTVGNHVYYGRYLNLLEIARGELFREAGTTFLQWQEWSCIFPVVECQVRYKRPARYAEVLTIETWLNELRGIRLSFGHRILNQNGSLIIEAETMHVCTGLDEKPRRLPEGLKVDLQRFAKSSSSGVA